MPIGGLCSGQLYLGGDGKLWFWDIFNLNYRKFQIKGVDAYEFPYKRSHPEEANARMIEQGFSIKVQFNGKSVEKTLDCDGIKDIRFLGQYPLGEVWYQDPELPVDVKLEAYSPFIPLELKRSLYPATVLTFKVKNSSDQEVEAELSGWLENAVLTGSRELTGFSASLQNDVSVIAGVGKRVHCSAEPRIAASQPVRRKDIAVVKGEDYHKKSTYWTVTEIDAATVATLLTELGDAKTVTKHATPEFKIERPLISCTVRGGNHDEGTIVRILVDGKVIASEVGTGTLSYQLMEFDVSAYEGRQATIEVINLRLFGWGGMYISDIKQRDNVYTPGMVRKMPDYGTMSLTLMDSDVIPEAATSFKLDLPSEESLVSTLSKSMKLAPQEEKTVTFILTWHFPKTLVQRGKPYGVPRYYSKVFEDASAVSDALIADFDELDRLTKLWVDNWYNSTLPYWFLDRTFLNMSTLATSTANYFADGIFMGWEGAYHSPGTTTHVWGYIQAIAMLFPELEISLREKVDFKLISEDGGMMEDGMIRFRWWHKGPAVDGQAGIILRSYMIHRSAKDDSFLRRNYAGIKKAMQGLTEFGDADHDGILTGAQHNTLDAAWYGKITWLSLHYTTALRAAAEMADEMGDHDYASFCRTIADKGRCYIEDHLFNGEYFFQEADPDHPDSPGTYNGLEYSQLLGQSWAYQVGLGEVVDPDKARTALESMWRYNFTTDVGPYRKKFEDGRWFAMPGEGGLIACTWPYGGSDVLKKGASTYAAYNNECQNGYEYAATSLMMWHGMPYHALAHMWYMHNDRYHGAVRNPWCEVEWGMHYSRSMASYGHFTAVSGFEYHGPKGHIGFAPQITPEKFKSAFTSAEAWGSFEQRRQGNTQIEKITVVHGTLQLKTLAFELPEHGKTKGATITLDGEPLEGAMTQNEQQVLIKLNQPIRMKTGQSLKIELR
ncbi:GH116 family glycosyl-hydrolase [Pontiella agarivorans]|uniref:GH116 family glycosyl-hydrolase n=1 Tax=Pontiella agarivorans TaxID=3038953 RepID=A0ABU5MW69_9BACT|nr:GH116 family glycosyl-hydrolase [Pontiella agarivorans]MDZ8118460.1 GH116 family glycosyl-hydrolase [Pontiella agarivorans]